MTIVVQRLLRLMPAYPLWISGGLRRNDRGAQKPHRQHIHNEGPFTTSLQRRKSPWASASSLPPSHCLALRRAAHSAQLTAADGRVLCLISSTISFLPGISTNL
jgi:hypothetical protein